MQIVHWLMGSMEINGKQALKTWKCIEKTPWKFNCGKCQLTLFTFFNGLQHVCCFLYCELYSDSEHSSEALWCGWKPKDSLHTPSSCVCCLPAGLQIQGKLLIGVQTSLNINWIILTLSILLLTEHKFVSIRMTNGKRSVRRSFPLPTRPSVHLSRLSLLNCLFDCSCKGHWPQARLDLRTMRL